MASMHASTSTAMLPARLLTRCSCQTSQKQLGSRMSQRHASGISWGRPTPISSDAVSKSTGKSLFSRIKLRAENAAINTRFLLPRMERAVLRQERQDNPAFGSIFDRALEEAEAAQPVTGDNAQISNRKVWSEHKTSTGNIKTSPRKLNDIARLIAKKPIDSAILQMQMSDKRVAQTRIKSMLVLARDHAIMKGLARDRLIVREAWVSKGVYLKRIDIKGRGRHGIIMKPESRMHVVLAPGLSRIEAKQQEMEKLIKGRLRTGAGFVREDRPIMNIGNMAGHGTSYAW